VLSSSSTHPAGRGDVRTAAARSSLEGWTLLVLRNRRAVLAIWAIVLALGAWASVVLPRHLVDSFAVPGTESERAAEALASGFGERPEGTFTVVFDVPRAPDSRLVGELRRRLMRAARAVPGGRLGSFRAGPGIVYGEIETPFGLQQAKRFTPKLRRVLRDNDASRVLVTGQPAVQHDLEPQLARDLRRGEALALPLALLVLAFVLGLSVALAVPFVFAACTIGGTVALLYVCAQFVAITPYALNVVELIGLGLAVDYSLIVVSRCREQLALGQSRSDVIAQTMATAGRAVAFSGAAVAIGLAMLVLIPVPFIRTLGLAGLLIPLVSVAAALTLQPVLLSFFPLGAARPAGGRAWRALARRITRRPQRVLAVAAMALVVAATPALFLDLTPGSLGGLPRAMEASRGLGELRNAFGPGAVTPTDVVVDAHRADGARRPAVEAAVKRLVDRLFHDPEVYVVAFGRNAPYVSSDARYTRVRIVARHEFGSESSRRLVERVRGSFVPAARFPRDTSVSVGGAAPQGVDFLSRVYSFFPWLVLAALVLTYLVLVRAFRSLLLPLKAVLLNLLSVGATCGLLVLIFGPEIEVWVPILLFATVFGLSMDYEVFLVSRMREARDTGRTTNDAIALGLEQTGGLITAAALVMAASFGGFVVGSVRGLQQLGVGLICAVFIEATVVRALLVPAAIATLGRWSWWLPARLVRKRVCLLAGAVVLALAAPGAATAASSTVRLVIAHVVQHCHVWRTPTRTLGASAKLTMKRGTRLVIRSDCPMDFDYVQKSGPKLPLANPRTFGGDTRVIVFRKAGIYRLEAINVQTPEERGLVTLGATNRLALTIVVN
jgi:RND superfamily putative drug exporter